jgi:hypothetical protein
MGPVIPLGSQGRGEKLKKKKDFSFLRKENRAIFTICRNANLLEKQLIAQLGNFRGDACAKWEDR